ncbi:uncharacterized protein LOC141596954 [Silene latifolia]|uniref:uncharacterized protein LOC141596954 n=1 Tax=Silene latifolia TaxID=37657 RepID=UPI003D78AF00
MMNLIALSLIATSFAVSGLFSPNPVSNERGEQVIVKDGHRAVVVEYADVSGDGNTKVSISPPHQQPGPPPEELSHAAAAVAGVSQHTAGPRELICDAFGKCKHKVAGVLGRAREKAAEAEEAVEEGVDTVKEMASRAGEKVGEKVEDVKGKVREAGERVGEKVGEVKGKVRETGEKVGEKVGDVKGKVKETGEKMKEKTEDLVEETKEKVIEKGREGKRELSDIVKRGKGMVRNVIGYVFSGFDSLGSLMNLMGVAMAYGMGVWVSFIMSYVLAGVLPRQQFALVQSKVYPVYFKAMVGSIGLGLLGHLLGHRGKVFKSKPEIFQGYNLMTSLLMVLANLLFLEPRATKVMFGRMKLEKEEGRGIDGRGTPARVIDTVVTDAVPTTTATATATHTTVAATEPATTRSEQDRVKNKLAKLDYRLKKLNSYSSLLNIMTLMGLTWHLVYLAQRLGVTT